MEHSKKNLEEELQKTSEVGVHTYIYNNHGNKIALGGSLSKVRLSK